MDRIMCSLLVVIVIASASGCKEMFNSYEVKSSGSVALRESDYSIYNIKIVRKGGKPGVILWRDKGGSIISIPQDKTIRSINDQEIKIQDFSPVNFIDENYTVHPSREQGFIYHEDVLLYKNNVEKIPIFK